MPIFKEPEVEMQFISNCFEVTVLHFWSTEEAGKEATHLHLYISSMSTNNSFYNLYTVRWYFQFFIW